jgi:hypothetical protein
MRKRTTTLLVLEGMYSTHGNAPNLQGDNMNIPNRRSATQQGYQPSIPTIKISPASLNALEATTKIPMLRQHGFFGSVKLIKQVCNIVFPARVMTRIAAQSLGQGYRHLGQPAVFGVSVLILKTRTVVSQ